ncbi:pectate lyase family protein [Saccharothrix luteola]|uniref:pectate lyase family protein n=1 Tax=Saccharothrix luteola TaxID=2893018 RepID=UPI001E5B0A94|nr:cellulose binding domain-containing protein [Saccharothrix luteola]MCC8245544.1 cellulose binding domain-containing protein [Saccharothrix luteola]
MAAGTNANAAAGCRVDYSVINQWDGGFGANVTVTNLGDPLSNWTLGWSFTAGQKVTQMWGGEFSQSGSAVTVRNTSWNGSLATGASVTPGFNGSWSGSNPTPTSFTLNGVACTGQPTNTSTSTSTSTTTSTTTTTTTTSNPPTGTATGFASQNGGTTGGQGGATVRATTGTQIHQALCSRAGSSTPIVIEVSGTINHGNTAKVSGNSCETAAGVIELKRISNVTIIGVGGGAVFDQLGIHIRESRNIIIRNVTIQNVKKSGSPTSNGGDAIGMESGVRNVWVDHVNLLASGGESEGYDGLFDMKDDTQYVTLSYSTLRNSGRGGLIGSSESDVSNGFVTYHHNLYENIDSRTPLLRGGIAHIYNNHYVSLNESGINSRVGAKAKVDNNYFKNSKDVLGTFYTTEAGYWQVSGNIFDNVTWSAPSSDHKPAGPDVKSTTTVSIPYGYALDQATCVPSVVSRTAGANTGLSESNGSC